MPTVKTRNSERWTEARYHAFIAGILRRGTRLWGPITDCRKDARKKAGNVRGKFYCAECEEVCPVTLPPKRKGGRRIKNFIVDHIDPVVDPKSGFVSWDDFIANLYCEKVNLQALCKSCHDEKTAEERTVRVTTRRAKKLTRTKHCDEDE